jgi:hypothetical protein
MSHYNKVDVLAAMQGRYGVFYCERTPLKASAGALRGACPIHHGTGPNFSVNIETGHWFCHTACKNGGDVFTFVERVAGYTFAEALEYIGEWAGCTPGKAPAPKTNSVSACAKSDKSAKSRIAKTYDYTDEGGSLIFQVVRYEPKDFRQRRPDQNGRWIWNLKGIAPVLHRLPAVITAVAAGKPIYVCEGEKDADALVSLGLCATTAPMGAEKWEARYTETLRGANVILLPDNDDPGRRHARTVALALHGQVNRLRVVDLPGLREKSDVSDWLGAGGTADKLLQLVKQTPDWQPDQAKVEDVAAAPLTATDTLPKPDPAMFHGLLGEYVWAVDEHTEADPVAVLVSLLVGFGIAVGRTAYCQVGNTRHYGNLFAVLVGDTASGKGSSWGMARPLLAAADPGWASKRLWSGLSTGEGLIGSVRDAVVKSEPVRENKMIVKYQDIIVDEGEADKRLLVTETEFARVLTVAGRDNSTLSAVMRQAWDGDDLKVMTKEKSSATAPHIGILGHITPADLKSKLTATDSANGFANRFLWLYVKRSKLLPEGGEIWKVNMAFYEQQLTAVLDFSKRQQAVRRDEEAQAVWGAVYETLTSARPGLLGAVTARGGPIVLRLSLLYALLDQSSIIRRVHLEAALALWDYAAASAQHIFGDASGDTVADDLLCFLKAAPDGLTRTQIRDKFSGHQTKERLDAVLLQLQQKGQAHSKKVATGGCPAEIWFSTV